MSNKIFVLEKKLGWSYLHEIGAMPDPCSEYRNYEGSLLCLKWGGERGGVISITVNTMGIKIVRREVMRH